MKQFHDLKGINKIYRPANSLNLNLIENVWRLLKQRMIKRFPRTLIELRQCIKKEWAALKLSNFARYISNIKERY
jgi:hypothetical protein